MEPACSPLLDRFNEVRAATMRFVRPLSPEDMMVQSCPEASPVKWHLAHTAWFFETFVLAEFLPGYEAFHPDFRWLFNSYYKALGEMPEKKLRASFSRPPLDEILRFREHVDAGVRRLLSTGEAPAESLRRIRLGLDHEQQHLELAATDIQHAFFTNPLQPAYCEMSITWPEPAAPVEWITFAEPGVVEIGIDPEALGGPAADDGFAFDNETPRHRVFLQPFALASRAVTCAEFLAFMEDGGYRRPELWLSEGWNAVESQGWQAPTYWRKHQDGWRIFTLSGWRSAEELASVPVSAVSFYEADAFARWSGHRLPTEAEWEHAAAGLPVHGNLLESGLLQPQQADGNGLTQMFGDVWEWTASAYLGYPGYLAQPGALGEYNGKFMSGQMVLRGGSCLTPVSHIRASYRNFFHPATRWQCSGLRLARNSTDLMRNGNPPAS